MVLQCDSNIIETYGALGYPFTNERIRFLELEDDAIAKQPSLDKLLAHPERDYLISNEGVKVPIHTLEDKVVALYFYYEKDTLEESLTEKFEKAYKELKKMNKNFEVVFVHMFEPENTAMYMNEKCFWKRFITMPWLALPLKDPNQKKLKRIFELIPYLKSLHQQILPPVIVIFGPKGEFVEPFGAEIFYQFGIAAYPFTRKKLAELKADKVKELKLEMLWDPNTIFRGKDGSQVITSQLSGKRVIVFVERVGCTHYTYSVNLKHKRESMFLEKLKERYLQMKGTDDEFEVIHLVVYVGCEMLDEDEYPLVVGAINSPPSEHGGDMPWLVSPKTVSLPADFNSYFCFHEIDFRCLYSPTLAFDRDGRLVRMTAYPTVESIDFPFYDGGLEDEALAQFNTMCRWNYWDYNPPSKGLIYSLRDKLIKVSL